VNARMTQVMGRARGMAAGYTPGQRGIIVVAVLALVMGAIALTNWVAQPTWTPLFSQLSGSDANAIVEQLRAENVQYQLADGGSTILVPQTQVYDLRVSLAGKGLPGNEDDAGWGLLDRQGMTATDFQQNVAYQRALEGELAKTVGAIGGVKTAVVHLAIPKRDVFADEQDKPTASVLLQLAPGTTMGKAQIRSVTHLVAGSVPGLEPSDVTVSDSTGAMLSAPENGTGGAASLANDADQQTAQYEDRKSTELQQMLDRVLGPGKAVVQVSAQLNYDTRQTTSETYLASPAVTPLSEATSREILNGGASGTGGPLGVISPTLSPLTGAASGQFYSKENRTVNNAVGKVVTQEQAVPGAVERLSIAVVLDAKSAGAVDTTEVQSLVASAAGVDSQRGDIVKVNKLPFDTAAVEEAKKELAKAEAAERTAGYVDLGTKAGIGLLVVIVVMIALLRRRKKGGPTVEASASDLPNGVLMPSRVDAISADRRRELGPGPDGETAGDGRGAPGAAPALEREKLRDEVASFVDSQPEEIAQLVQGWLAQRGS
jgi:flagellar M-ring protein FliF